MKKTELTLFALICRTITLTIPSLIDNFLNNYNLAKNPISDEEIEENIKNIYRNNVLTLVREEIKLFKASQTNIEDAKEKFLNYPINLDQADS